MVDELSNRYGQHIPLEVRREMQRSGVYNDSYFHGDIIMNNNTDIEIYSVVCEHDFEWYMVSCYRNLNYSESYSVNWMKI